MKGSQPFYKYLLTRESARYLHIVARKGGEVVYTMCGGAFPKLGSRTLTEVPGKTFYVCSDCVRVMK